jgi:phage tail P2-like protein
MDSLIYKKTAAEAAIEAACSRIEDVPVPIGALWDPQSCPAASLPWLAWALSVDEWDAAWPDTAKRAAVAASYPVHARKGSVAAVRMALEAAGYAGAEVIEHRDFFRQWLDAGGLVLDGSGALDGTGYLAPADGDFRFVASSWAEYFVRISDATDGIVSPEAQQLVVRMVTAAAPVRSHLVGIVFDVQLWWTSVITLSMPSAIVAAIYSGCNACHVPRYEIVGSGCRAIGGYYVPDLLDGDGILDGLAGLDGLAPAGAWLDKGHWGSIRIEMEMPAYTQAAGLDCVEGRWLDANYRYILDPLDGRRDLSGQTLDGAVELSGFLGLASRPLTRMTYDMLDGSRHLGLLPGPEGVWHSGCVDFWHGNTHYREVI